MALKGDFCYVIWFDDRGDADHFLKKISRVRYAWMIKSFASYGIVWDIGTHK
jgi:predicted CDP-diglyceride synthetase/phosphatidate cytidylyltransferase